MTSNGMGSNPISGGSQGAAPTNVGIPRDSQRCQEGVAQLVGRAFESLMAVTRVRRHWLATKDLPEPILDWRQIFLGGPEIGFKFVFSSLSSWRERPGLLLWQEPDRA